MRRLDIALQELVGGEHTSDDVIDYGRDVLVSLKDKGLLLDSAAFNIIISMAWRSKGGGIQASEKVTRDLHLFLALVSNLIISISVWHLYQI